MTNPNRGDGLGGEFYARIDELVRIGSRAVLAAQEESRRPGVPNVYSTNGILHDERPSGELSTMDPTETAAGGS